MAFLEHEYLKHCRSVSDINEHLPTLYKYAKECSHITECGVRDVVSSYAFAWAIVGKPGATIIQIDPYKSDLIERFQDICEMYPLTPLFYEQSDLECPLEKTDLLFIDTWHIYGQLKRELARWHAYVTKYIILHDTTVDGEIGESIRNERNIDEEMMKSGFSREDICKGLWPAVEEFLESHPEWHLKERFINNNGLTVLERIHQSS